ncbi:pyranose oxidase [Ceratobasidium sp. AG-I]|nr:pyranose oxidase [Ceratobasidium sp. AG-I]
MAKRIEDCDVFIAGSGPIGATFARIILEELPNARIIMCEIGSQDNPKMGAHHKNSVKYQKDIDAFVHVIQGALQPVSIPPAKTHMSTLGDVAWTPPPGSSIMQAAHNPDQKPEENLPGCAVTRTVGGMATHWTCACPRPRPEEYKNKPTAITDEEFKTLLGEAEVLLNVHDDQYDNSIRHNIVKNALEKHYGPERKNKDAPESKNKDAPERVVESLPLAVKRRDDNPDLVIWSGTDTILKEYAAKVDLRPETRVTRLSLAELTHNIDGALCRNLVTKEEYWVRAKKYVIACGAVCTPQVLHYSRIISPALGKSLTEQSIAFCQIVLSRELIDNIPEKFAPQIKKHKDHNKKDILPIPFNDPEPQVTIPYSNEAPWHTQIHRDAFSYGDVGPRADPRVIVDLRFFGKQDIKPENRIEFSPIKPNGDPEITDLYGMPQATFFVKRSPEDAKRDHKMMLDMCGAANALGAFLPGSYPQFMEPGLALHITGTTRLGDDPEDSVANANSQVHSYEDLYVGGNGCIPDSTACNPTLTSVAYAIKAARHIVSKLSKSGILKPASKSESQCVVCE